jgi:hypothetical protein
VNCQPFRRELSGLSSRTVRPFVVNCQAFRRELSSQPFSSVTESCITQTRRASSQRKSIVAPRRATNNRTLVPLLRRRRLRTTQRDLFELPVTDRRYLEFNMSSKGKVLREISPHRCILAIIILCTSVGWASVDALAQKAAPAPLKITAHSSLWSLEGPGSNTAPHLLIGMADRVDTSYGSLRLARDEATNPSASTISRLAGPVASVNHAGKGDSGPLVLSSLFEPTEGVRGSRDFHAESTIRRQTIRSSSDQTGAKIYSLLDDGPVFESPLYGYQANYLSSKQWLTDDESFTHEVVQAPRPLFELEFGGWRLPVMLSGAAVSR